MKKLLLGFSLSLAVSTAFAADAIIEDVAALPVFVWTGGYVGLQAGYAWGDSTLDFDGTDYIVPLDPEGFLGGVYAGYNYQFASNIVLGAEADFQFSAADSSDVLGIFNGGVDPRFRYYSDQKWNASLRARLGYAVDRFLPFVTAGVAFAEYEHGEALAQPFSETDTYTGWTIGGGADYAVTDNFVVRAEYRYSDFGSESFEPLGWTAHDVELSTHDVRLGVAYKF